MLSHLDCIIFPDRCEVIELIPSQRYVYPIFKNASSSLYVYAEQHKCRIKINEQIKSLQQIDVVLRDPKQRFVSGLNTFVQFVTRENPNLDKSTVLWFAKNYLFLNRHYSPQFAWLVNLFRYMSSTAKLNFVGMDQVWNMTQLHEIPKKIKPVSEEFVDQIHPVANLEMYQAIDQCVYDHALGRSMTATQLLTLVKQHEPQAYDWVITRSQKILEPTYALS